MVRLCVLRWNYIEPSIILLYEKLIDTGFIYCDDAIRIVGPITEEIRYRV
jgi:hypothetical protein